MKLFKDIYSIQFFEDIVLLKDSNHQLLKFVKDDIKKIELTNEKKIVGNVFYRNNKLFFTENVGKNYSAIKLDLSSLEETVISEGTILHHRNDKSLISALNNSEFNLEVFNELNQLLWTKNENSIWIKLFANETIYATNNNKEDSIFKYNLLSGKEYWSIPETTAYNTVNDNPFFVTAIDGWVLYKNDLFVPLRNGKILLVNDEIGEVKEVFFSDNLNGQYGKYYHDPHRNKLVKIIRETIHELDLNTCEIEYFELPRLKQKDAEHNGGEWAQDENHIYYCSFDGTTLNALNKKTKEIDGQYKHNLTPINLDLKNEIPTRYKSVNCHKSQLFVMDNKRNLHVLSVEDLLNKKLEL